MVACETQGNRIQQGRLITSNGFRCFRIGTATLLRKSLGSGRCATTSGCPESTCIPSLYPNYFCLGPLTNSGLQSRKPPKLWLWYTLKIFDVSAFHKGGTSPALTIEPHLALRETRATHPQMNGASNANQPSSRTLIDIGQDHHYIICMETCIPSQFPNTLTLQFHEICLFISDSLEKISTFPRMQLSDQGLMVSEHLCMMSRFPDPW